MPCGAIWALFVFACRGRRPDGPNLGLNKFSYSPSGGLPSARRLSATEPFRQGTLALPYRGFTLSAGRGAYTPPRGERIATTSLRAGLAMTKAFARSYYENSYHLHRRA